MRVALAVGSRRQITTSIGQMMRNEGRETQDNDVTGWQALLAGRQDQILTGLADLDVVNYIRVDSECEKASRG